MNRKRTLVGLVAVAAAVSFALLVVPAPASEQTAAVDAKDLYVKKCAMCHGTDGVAKSMGQGSANFNDPEWQKTASIDEIAKVTLEGKNKMPKFEGKMTAEEIQAVSVYVKSMK